MKHLLKAGLILGLSCLAVACHKDDDNMMSVTPTTIKYRVTVTNMTAGQPFSPPVLVLHNTNFHLFTEGKGASVGLEMLAESGKNSELTAEVQGYGQTHVVTDSTSPILAGQSRSYTLETNSADDHYLSMASMLGKTNDGFTGADHLALNLNQTGDKMTVQQPAWDAGTEANTETAATLGALGGEGFNPMRNDWAGVITLHAGVVGNIDNPNSGLSEMQRFDNPVLQLTIERL